MSEKTDFGFEQVAPEEKARRVRGVFESVAGKYDLMNDLMSAGLHRAWKRFTVETSGVREGARVLDVAGGTADLARLFADRVGATGTRRTDRHQRRHACRRTRPPVQRRSHRPRGAMRRREAAVSGAGTSTACASVSACATSRARKPRSPRCAACCRPGGVALILEFSRVWAPLQPAYDWYSFNVLPRLGKAVAGDDASYRYLAESIRVHPDQPTLKAMMEQAGFERVDWFNLAAGVVALHRGHVF